MNTLNNSIKIKVKTNSITNKKTKTDTKIITNATNIKPKVYMVLYNYSLYDYSVIKIISNLNDAFKYICCQEDKILNINKKNITNQNTNVQMKQIKSITELNDLSKTNDYNICCIEDDNYLNYDICCRDNVSNYVIVPMTVN